MIKIVDNIISKCYQDHIENAFTSPSFPWFYGMRGITMDANDTTTGFHHLIYINDETNNNYHRSSYFDIFLPILLQASNAEIKNLLRIRASMFLKNQNDVDHHLPHIDYDLPHYTMIYYVNDSDGPTHIFENEKIIEKVEPIKGRCLIMDGNIYHASSCPKINTHRMIINFNFQI